jgi:hypothetical protein
VSIKGFKEEWPVYFGAIISSHLKRIQANDSIFLTVWRLHRLAAKRKGS